MKKRYLIFGLLMVGFTAATAQIIPSKEVQIKGALLASPDPLADEATIYGYDSTGKFTVLKKGTNNIICLADDPSKDGFSASCYHKDLEPFMERGRELKKQGKSFQEISLAREEEVKSGKLTMPPDGTTLFVYYASEESYNRDSGEVKNGSFRYVVYIPYATAETTGLPLSPSVPGMPWIMDPGTHRAHIMITPPPK
jgi:hypothetical protein